MMPASIQAVYVCVKLLNKAMLAEGGGVRLNKAGRPPAGSRTQLDVTSRSL
jgi:hypothetical protein